MKMRRALVPYYQKDGVTLYHGDARRVLEDLTADVVIVDPVWPDASAVMPGSDRPWELFAEIASHFPHVCKRAVVHLGCDSDPRFLAGVPDSMLFLRVCSLDYACPVRKGRLLYSGDVAYVFGTPPVSAPGRRLMPGRMVSTRPDAKRVKLTRHGDYGRPVPGLHPCPRRYEHVRWLVSRFADGVVLDPCCGSGTTLLAAKECGYATIGIEISEEYCRITVERLRQGVFDFEDARRNVS